MKTGRLQNIEKAIWYSPLGQHIPKTLEDFELLVNLLDVMSLLKRRDLTPIAKMCSYRLNAIYAILKIAQRTNEKFIKNFTGMISKDDQDEISEDIHHFLDEIHQLADSENLMKAKVQIFLSEMVSSEEVASVAGRSLQKYLEDFHHLTYLMDSVYEESDIEVIKEILRTIQSEYKIAELLQSPSMEIDLYFEQKSWLPLETKMAHLNLLE